MTLYSRETASGCYNDHFDAQCQQSHTFSRRHTYTYVRIRLTRLTGWFEPFHWPPVVYCRDEITRTKIFNATTLSNWTTFFFDVSQQVFWPTRRRILCGTKPPNVFNQRSGGAVVKHSPANPSQCTFTNKSSLIFVGGHFRAVFTFTLLCVLTEYKHISWNRRGNGKYKAWLLEEQFFENRIQIQTMRRHESPNWCLHRDFQLVAGDKVADRYLSLFYEFIHLICDCSSDTCKMPLHQYTLQVNHRVQNLYYLEGTGTGDFRTSTHALYDLDHHDHSGTKHHRLLAQNMSTQTCSVFLRNLVDLVAHRSYSCCALMHAY